jgi:two-component sensor histidine kinase
MVFHELITNAAKYGALSQPEGRLNIEWSLQQDGAQRVLSLVWQESGGPPVEKPKRMGFGTKMVERSIPAELDGTASLQFEPAGVRCELRFPLAEIGERESSRPKRSSRIRRRG